MRRTKFQNLGKTAIWKTCSNNLCVNVPFTGNCTAASITNPRFGSHCACFGGLGSKTITPKANLLFCEKCKIGRYGQGDTFGCSICPKGTYSTEEGALECKLCPHGTYLDDEINADRHDNIDDCLICPSGKYLIQDNPPNACML